jgi:hypothetical protein
LRKYKRHISGGRRDRLYTPRLPVSGKVVFSKNKIIKLLSDKTDVSLIELEKKGKNLKPYSLPFWPFWAKRPFLTFPANFTFFSTLFRVFGENVDKISHC